MTKLGRPKLLARDRSKRIVGIRLTLAEFHILEQAAAKARLSLSNYIRSKLELRESK